MEKTLTIQAIRTCHYNPIARLETQRGARTSLYDPASHRLYLIVPRQDGRAAPEVWVFETKH
jgi:hypothetical protein